jgi:hypothetical protein
MTAERMTRSKARRIGTMNANSDADSAPGGPGERGPPDRRRCPSHPWASAGARSSQPIGGSPTRSAFWRYATLAQRIAEHHGLFTTEDLKANNACVNVQKLLAEMGAGWCDLRLPPRLRETTDS